MKARFEEAKKRELAVVSSINHQKKGGVPDYESSLKKGPVQHATNGRVEKAHKNCFNCGMSGHMMKSCPYPKQKKEDRESRGRKDPSIATVTAQANKMRIKSEIEKLQRKLNKTEIDVALEDMSATMYGVTLLMEGTPARLGPTITTNVAVNGIDAVALIVTGSPATIISLKFAMGVLAKERQSFNSPQEWKKVMAGRFEAPSVTLKSYGGGRLNIVAQLRVTLCHGNFNTNTTVLVQKDAPNELLIGTDVQSSLGFSLVISKDGTMKDLLKGDKPNLNPPGMNQDVTRDITPTGTVRLLQAV